MPLAANSAPGGPLPATEPIEPDSPVHPAGRSIRWPLLAAAVLVVALLALLSAVIWRTAGSSRDRYWDHIQQTGRWRVGMDPSFPPFEDLAPGDQLVGFDVDLAQAIAARWGVQAEIVSVGFDSLVDAVWTGKLDSAISALPYQPHLTQDVAFSSPYFEAGLVLVTSSAHPDIQSVDDLAGRRLAVEWGSEGDVQARALRRRFPDLEITPLDLPQAALQAVAEGRADAAMVDHISALQYIAGDPRLHIIPPALVSDAYVIVMPLKAPILRAEVDKALAALKADGTLDALTEKWLGASDGALGAP